MRSWKWLLLLLAASPLLAQGVSGSITGALRDASGAMVPNSSVTARSVDSGRDWQTQTNEAGIYNLPALPPGRYTLTVEVPGFKRLVTNPITLEVNQTARIDLTLEVGAVAETVEVKDLAPLLSTENTQLGSVITGSTTSNLPLNGRNFAQLTLLAPGVVTYDIASFTSVNGGGRPLVNGNRAQANNFRLDGMDANEIQDNGIGFSPNVDAIQEFKLITTNAPAEYGNSMGAIINTSLKSGTNQYHGSLFEFVRNDHMDSNTWFGNATNQRRPQFSQNVFGGTVGGPIQKNRLFFFADYQGTRRARGLTGSVFTVIPTAWRTGDMSSQTKRLFNPLSQVDNGNGTVTRDPFPNNQIPSSLISPVARNLFADPSIYPLPLTAANSNNWNGAGRQNVTNDVGDFKIDYALSTKDNLTSRFSMGETDDISRNALRVNPTQPGINTPRSGVISWNHTFSPRLLNEARVGVNRTKSTSLTTDTGHIGTFGEKIGIPGANSPGPGLPLLTISDVSSIGARGSDSIAASTTYQYTDTVTFTRGRHIFKAGAEVLRYQQNRFYGSNNGLFGAFTFSGAYTQQIGVNNTGSGVADFLLGVPVDVGKSVAVGWGHRSIRMGYFFQDDFKLRSNLTLNLGLRYEYITPYVEVADRQTSYDLGTGKQFFAGKDGNSRALYNSYKKGFQPRFGLAWTPDRFHGKSVVRIAWGVLNYLESTGTNRRLTQNPPYVYDFFLQYDNRFIGQKVSDGFPKFGPALAAGGGPPSGSIRVWPNVVKPAIIQQWNVTVEHQVANNLTVSAAYVGQDASHLMISDRYWSQPVLGTGPVQQRRRIYPVMPLVTELVLTNPVGRQNYQGFQLSARKRFSGGLEFTSAYTWSHTLSNNGGFYGPSVGNQPTTMQDYGNRRAEWGSASMDIRHNWISSYNYEFPIGHNKRLLAGASRLTDAVLGGWMTSGVLTFRTGLPLTIGESPDTSNAGALAPRPDAVKNGNLARGVRGPDGWFDTAAFVRQAPNTFGNAGVGTIFAPGIANVDFALQKRFRVTESKQFEFRAEAFNIFNTPLFTGVGRTLGAATFGKITSAQAERELQLGLKFYF
ncbi:MAG: TonB-dependent receptor [Acidobacteria bacterium]|nr:TonB-dependent receptor [Acidobacteriota bacterium]